MTASLKIFKGLHILLIQSPQFAESEITSVVEQLVGHGAAKTTVWGGTDDEKASTKEWIRDNFRANIHCIIAADIDFPFYRSAAFDLMVPVVTPNWCSACVKNGRLMRTTGFSPDPEHFLKECYIYISKHALSTAEYELFSAMISFMGGCCMDFLSTKVTHIITTDPRDPATLALERFGKLSVHSVTPTWIAECFACKQIVSTTPYILDKAMEESSVRSCMVDNWFIDDKDWSWTSSIFLGHTFYLSMELPLKTSCYKFLIQLISAMGGQIARYVDFEDISPDRADSFIDLDLSKDCVYARGKGLHCGNMAWLFYMLSMQQFIAPTAKLVLSPRYPKLFTEKELVLAFTNYLGQQRYYIQRLVDLLGGSSTTELSRKNTHLISLFPHGKKHETALKWNSCIVVNHLWLEQCYKLRKKLDPNAPEFTRIPVPDELSNAIGQMALETTARNMVSPRKAVSPDIVMHNSQTDVALVVSTTDIDLKDNNESTNDTSVVHEPGKVMNSDDLTAVHSTKTRQEDANEMFSALDEAVSKGKKSCLPKKHIAASVAASTSNEISASAKSNKDSSDVQATKQLPATPTSNPRQTKPKSTSGTQNDTASSQKNTRRKNADDSPSSESSKTKKRKTTVVDAKQLVSPYLEEYSDTTGGRLPYDIKAVFTNCHENITDLDKEILRQLGIILQEEIEEDTNCIIGPKKARTAKFLTSFSFHPLKYALLPKFITEILSLVHSGRNEPISLPLEQYYIPDIDADVIAKTELPTKLFERSGLQAVNLSEDIPGGVEVISSILKAHGMVQINGLPKKFKAKDIAKNTVDNGSPDFVLVATKASAAKKFSKLCEEVDRNAKVLIVEWNWCVKAIFSLEVDYNDPEFVISKTGFA
ncbi:ADL145Cp [Eremothecium gossypii ATCC 10895]|uniref:ADL145Cp n=1 Tax=Eremothecium gossypii (strain ATCC 10895 / CBS 109.51 / FGSC 9923 / NRRL Y-1056) TaxID=284811 RepID=Q75AR5_EREGS|nr:ADL145Cp [Eremothecium gossypii ATCC 10895]AAS51775.1 ADL145Cp [Eremothecium gossypii ATCC 10895]AEY96073.1 FADL145Cp [Eremothecium gossypii FDAG1]